jgi:hypothetical protein
MLAVPASIAPPPSPKSRVYWSPAVPPPPVCGASAGVTVTVTVAVGVAVAAAVAVAVAVAVLLDVVLLDVVLLDEVVDVGGEWVPSGVDEDEDGEHPASATARMAKTPKPLTVSFALSTVSAMITRSVM